MGKIKLVLAGTALVGVVAGLSACAIPNYPSAQVLPTASFGQQSTGIWVTGEGKVMATPDVAILNIGVDVQAKTVADAQGQATAAMDKVVKALLAGGVKDKDIQTQRFGVQPVTRWIKEENREEVLGYRVTNMVTAKVRDLNKTGAVIDAAVTAGGNQIRVNGISFSVDDTTMYYKEARDKALADATAKARQIAAGLGINVGKPTYVSEGSVYVPQPKYYEMDSRAMASAPAASPAPPISAGELEVRLNVQVVYNIG